MPADTESALVDEAIARCEAVIDELWPDLKHHIVRKEPYGAKQISSMSRDVAVPGCGGEAVGIAQVVGQCGSSKPDARTPLPGLYIVGCDAAGAAPARTRRSIRASMWPRWWSRIWREAAGYAELQLNKSVPFNPLRRPYACQTRYRNLGRAAAPG